jgi:uncharacterized protein involved in exopolysaccharide biosynthesis
MMPQGIDQDFNESDSIFSFRDLLTPLFRRWRTMLWTFLSISMLAIGFISLSGPSYTSRMAILVNRERQDPLVTTGSTKLLAAQANPITDEEVNSEVELLQSRDVLEQVVRDTGLAEVKRKSLLGWLRPPQTRDAQFDKAVTGLAKKLKVAVITKTNIIEVSYSSSNPNLAYRVLHSLEERYQQKNLDVHRPAGSYDFFARQTDIYQEALKSSEDKLRNFVENTGVASPDAQQLNLAQQLALAIGQVHAAEQAMAAAQARIKIDKTQLLSTPVRSMTTQSNAEADRLVGDFEVSLLAAKTKRTELLAKFAPNYPSVVEADNEVKEVSAALDNARRKRFTTDTTDRDPTYELVRADLAHTEEEFEAQQAMRSATQRSVASLQAQMVNLDRQSIDRNDLLRTVKANEDSYLLYLSKRDQERMADALDKTKIANVGVAAHPTIPVLPAVSEPFAILIALIAAAVLSVLAAYAFDYFDSSLFTPDQVSEVLNIPLVFGIRKAA